MSLLHNNTDDDHYHHHNDHFPSSSGDRRKPKRNQYSGCSARPKGSVRQRPARMAIGWLSVAMECPEHVKKSWDTYCKHVPTALHMKSVIGDVYFNARNLEQPSDHRNSRLLSCFAR